LNKINQRSILQNMKNLIFVVFLLLFTHQAYANRTQDLQDLEARVHHIESIWLNNHQVPKDNPKRKNIFLKLTEDITDVVLSFPKHAEPLILKSAILLTMAEDASNFLSLGLVKEAKKLLLKAIDINPEANHGAALVTLGVLYYKVPSWPISFKDEDEAEFYLSKALAVNPAGIDSNYYYADFLIDQGKEKQALPYLNKAINVKIDPNHPDFMIQQREQHKAKLALSNLR